MANVRNTIKKKGGRPDSEDAVYRVLEGIKAGMSYEGACGVARVTYNTFLNWRKRGEVETSGKYFKFFQELRYAEAIAEAEMLKKLKEDPDTKWVAWRLERRFPDRWGKKEQVKQEISGPEGQPIQVNTNQYDQYSDEELSTLENLLRKRESK
jgi:transposase